MENLTLKKKAKKKSDVDKFGKFCFLCLKLGGELANENQKL